MSPATSASSWRTGRLFGGSRGGVWVPFPFLLEPLGGVGTLGRIRSEGRDDAGALRVQAVWYMDEW